MNVNYAAYMSHSKDLLDFNRKLTLLGTLGRS